MPRVKASKDGELSASTLRRTAFVLHTWLSVDEGKMGYYVKFNSRNVVLEKGTLGESQWISKKKKRTLAEEVVSK